MFIKGSKSQELSFLFIASPNLTTFDLYSQRMHRLPILCKMYLSTLHSLLLTMLAIPPLTLAKPLIFRQEVVPPPECDVIPPWVVTTFSWYNSTHNLDCVTGPDIGDGTTCFNSTSSGTVTCDPSQGPCDICGVYACDTGLPYVPLGYGPPDNVTIDIENGYQCFQTNPQTVHRFEVGDGIVMCGGTAYHINFFGDSNEAISTGHIDYNPITNWDCTNGSTITGYGSVDFPVFCTYDAGNNATCTTETPFGKSMSEIFPLQG